MRKALPTRARRGRPAEEASLDPYVPSGSLTEPSVCPDCRAVYSQGRWQWTEPPAGAAAQSCQACSRIRDGSPAGTVTACGEFVRAHKDEIVRLARHQAGLENKDFPLHRIMRVEELPDAVAIMTTDICLPRRIGEAIRRAFQGSLHAHYQEGSYSIRVSWERE